MINIESIKKNLKTKYIGKQIKYYQSIDSTNIEAFRLINQGKSSVGDVILAEEQTNGKGQSNNTWDSPKGNLYLSFINLFDGNIDCKLTTFATGLAVLTTLKELYDITAKLKWINDIIIDEKKLGGILTESKTRGQQSLIVTGIGININTLPDISKKQFNSTSISEILDKNVCLNTFIAKLLENIELYIQLLKTNRETILFMWKKHSYSINKKVSFSINNICYKGTIENIDKNGFLQILTDDDQLLTLTSTVYTKIKYL